MQICTPIFWHYILFSENLDQPDKYYREELRACSLEMGSRLDEETRLKVRASYDH